jgi:hypothetical protein
MAPATIGGRPISESHRRVYLGIEAGRGARVMDLYGSQLGEVSFSGACGGSQQEDVESCVLIAAIPGWSG